MAGLFVDKLTVIDCSFLDRERGVVGESWIVDIVLEGELNNEGMVFDFGHVKTQIKQAIDRHADHKLLVPEHMPDLHLESDNSVFSLRFHSARGAIAYRSPRQAVCVIPAERITPEHIKSELLRHIRAVVPANVSNIRIDLHTEDIDGAYYHYSHGLKKHAGDCQRICHGHRSRIEIQRNAKRDPALEREWAARWRDIYLVTREDIVQQGENDLTLAYRSGQGEFSVTLPAEHCDILPGDTTVELIADHIAQTLKQQYPDDHFTVKAYEGLNKGALSQS